MKLNFKFKKFCAKIAVACMALQLLAPLYPGFLFSNTGDGTAQAATIQNFCLPADINVSTLPADIQKELPKAPANPPSSCLFCILCQTVSSDWNLLPGDAITVNQTQALKLGQIWDDRPALTRAKFFNRHTTRAPPVTL